MTKTIGILLFDGVQELDAIGPFEVLGGWTRMHPDDGWRTTTVGRSGDGPVRGDGGLVMTPQVSLDDVGHIDLLVYPGGRGAREAVDDIAHLDWVRGQAGDDQITTSVCTGALVLAAAGLLKNRPATTHWGALDRLAALDPTIELRPDDRYVDAGDIVTPKASRRASTWRSTWWLAWPETTEPAKSDGFSSTTRCRRSDGGGARHRNG